MNEAWSQSASGTLANEARAWSAAMADLAWQRDMEAFEKQMDFNREEAKKQRDWQAKMANTIYTRSVKNMREAGINPILAFRMGLSGADVGSGATASLGGSPSAPLAQNFMDSWSGSSSYSHGSSSSYGEGGGESWGEGSSWGSGWSNSEEGIVTALNALGGMANAGLNAIQSGEAMETINNYIQGGGELVGDVKNQVVNGVKDFLGSIGDKIQQRYSEEKDKEKPYANTGGGGGHGFNKKMKAFN